MDTSTKRAKVDQETEQVNPKSNGAEAIAANIEQNVPSTSLENVACTSIASSMVKQEAKAEDVAERSGYDQLPKEMHEMKIRDERSNSHDEKVILHWHSLSPRIKYVHIDNNPICFCITLRATLVFYCGLQFTHKQL